MTAKNDEGPALDPDAIDRLRQLGRDGEPDMARQVLRLFLTDAPGRVQAMAAAIARRDRRALERAAHALKGAAAAIGAHDVHGRCRELEAAAKAGVMDGLDARLADLRAALDRARLEAERLLDDTV